MNLLFEDNQIIVCIKPAGISSQERPDKRDMVNELIKHCEKQGITNPQIFPVHRLDTATAGIMVYAKTKTAAAFLSNEITQNNFQKEYLAIVHGVPEEKTAVLEDLLFRDTKKNKSYVVKRERKGVKKASLTYTLIKMCTNETDTFSLLKIRLHTGRTHQIRVQFASRKMPLLGDGKYGAADNIPTLGLFSCSLSFTHPTTKERLTFTASPENKFPWDIFE
ncbi:MAG: RluA family pseudouridine synthase [Clostridia bacterium]|nr:RluA family pseudouridine synthase [Clostridia bacterium]